MKQKINLTIKGEELKKKLNIKDGKDGKDGLNGSDAVIDYDKVIRETTDQIKPIIPLSSELIKETEFNLEKNLPQFGKQFRDGLELLDGTERLNKDAILGLEDYDEVSRLAREPKVIEKKIITGGGAKSLQEVTDLGSTTTNTITVPAVQLNTSATPTSSIGQFQWNSQDVTADLKLDSQVTLQVGQETLIRVVNKTGSDIIDGTPVYLSGAQGNRPKVGLAKGDTHTTGNAIGLTTEHITNNQEGFITVRGLVRDLNTTGSPYGETWSDGDTIWVSKTTAGYLTNVEPTVPHHSNKLGLVVRAHATQGQILVQVSQHQTLESLSDVNGTALTTDGQFPSWHNTGGYFDFDKNINDYVPYTGATSDVDLGYYKILGSEFVSNTGGFKIGNFTGYGGTEITTSDAYSSGWSVLRMFPKSYGASSIEFYRNDPIAGGGFGDFSRMRWDANYANPGHYTFISEATGAETVGNIYWNIAGNNYGAMTAMGSLIWGSPYDFEKGYSFQTQKAWVGSDFPAYSFTTTAFNVVQDLANGAVDCMTVVANDAGDSLNTGFFIKADLYNQYGIHISELISVNANTGGPAPISFNGEWNGDTTAPVLIHTYTDNGSGAILQVNGSATFNGRVIEQGTFAEIYVADGSTSQSIASGATYTKLTAFTTNGSSSNCTADASNDKITITKAGKYLVTCAVSGHDGVAGATFKMALFAGGSEKNNIHATNKFNAGSEVDEMSMSGIVSVSANTDLDVRLAHDGGASVNFITTYANLTVVYVGE